jgi:hypothetical protein
MLEINVYSIIHSKVFGVTFGVNFFLPIVEYKFNYYKHVVEVERIQVGTKGGVIEV